MQMMTTSPTTSSTIVPTETFVDGDSDMVTFDAAARSRGGGNPGPVGCKCKRGSARCA
jgi:hypothetical protein